LPLSGVAEATADFRQHLATPRWRGQKAMAGYRRRLRNRHIRKTIRAHMWWYTCGPCSSLGLKILIVLADTLPL